METNDFLQGIFAQYPFLAVIGPLVGLIMARIIQTGKVQGLMLLVVALLVSTVVTGAYGLAEGWVLESWRKAPLAILVILSVSQLTTQTTLQAHAAMMQRAARKAGDSR